MKKEIVFTIIFIPLVVFLIIGSITYMNLISGIVAIAVWIVGFLISSIGVTYFVAREQIRALDEEDAKKNDE